MKADRAQIVQGIIKTALGCADITGSFGRGEVLGKCGFRGARVYRIFKELIDSGDIIPVNFKAYRLNNKLLKVVKMPSEAIKSDDGKALEIIEYLNEVLGTRLKATDKVKSLVSARIREGHSLDDFKTVIDKKYAEWGKTDMAKYLRPETLFGNKFNGYLNQLEGQSKAQRLENMDFDKYFKGA
jgi:uncharacterized phage protein (TIGR02220 family)